MADLSQILTWSEVGRKNLIQRSLRRRSLWPLFLLRRGLWLRTLPALIGDNAPMKKIASRKTPRRPIRVN
jgi:hypothetical protein